MFSNKVFQRVSQGGKSEYIRGFGFCIRVSNHPANAKFFEDEDDDFSVLSIIVGATTSTDYSSEKSINSDEEGIDLILDFLNQTYERSKDEIDVSIYQHLDWETAANYFDETFFEEETI